MLLRFEIEFPFMIKYVTGMGDQSLSSIKHLPSAKRTERKNRIQNAIIKSLGKNLDWWDKTKKIKMTVYVSAFVIHGDRRETGDVDNILGSIMDASKGLLFDDDNQVWEAHIIRLDDDNGRAFVTVDYF